jgi:hypothetical protein
VTELKASQLNIRQMESDDDPTKANKGTLFRTFGVFHHLNGVDGPFDVGTTNGPCETF